MQLNLTKYSKQQWLGLLRALLAAGSPLLLFFGATGPLAKLMLAYGMSPGLVDAWANVVAGILSVASLVVVILWSANSNSPASQTIDAAGSSTSPTPGVTVTVDPKKAAPEVVAAAKDQANAVKLSA